ncbi:hypothetical protein B7494_g4490 [Chlorociboria aeruginascens]|nr:hypothetical protein B7494_g4490 [Chlorociboria aeruginascens]
MASQQDIQDLLRLLTTGRNKLPMLAAMARVKILQSASLTSITSIAASDLPTLKNLLSDEKAAKSLLAVCKAHVKDPASRKRSSDSSLSSIPKRTKSAYELQDEPQTPQEYEASLELPQPSADEEKIETTRIWTNRAPLVLAFAVQLLKYTMPEQPLSGRLSLAQAVVSANSRGKAVSLGLERGKGADEEGWGVGMPKVSVMGREISVLKRGGYGWHGEEKDLIVGNDDSKEAQGWVTDASGTTSMMGVKEKKNDWSISEKITSKKSIFVARSIAITSIGHAKSLIQRLLSDPSVQSADHNITAFRYQNPQGFITEESNDDGESGGGRHILNVLQTNNITNVLLVVTRWYGGIMLGPDRWRIMSQVSRDALSQRLRVTGVVGQEALWGLDLEAMRSSENKNRNGIGEIARVGMPIHRPEGARNYILKSFAMPEEEGVKKKKKTGAMAEREKEENLGLLLGALDMLFDSWAGFISREELDKRAWGWYVNVRPDVESGVAGWGGKGEVKLGDILNLRRKG